MLPSKFMPPRSSPRSTQYDFSGKTGEDKFFSVIKAIQEETVRDYLERSDYLMKEDIDAAWKVLVPNGETSVNRADLVERLSYYSPHTDTATTTTLIGGGGNYSYERLLRLLWNDQSGDPQFPCNVGKESWALLDPHGRGTVTFDTVLRMLTTISGCDKLDQDDVQVVRQLLEMTAESSVFREENWSQLGTWSPKLEELTPAQRKLLAARGSGFSLRGPAKLSGGKWG